MTDMTEIKPEIKLSYYKRVVATNPELKKKETERVISYITKKYHEDPEYKAKRLEYQKKYDTEKRARIKALKELKYVTVPIQMCEM